VLPLYAVGDEGARGATVAETRRSGPL
jgi:hypothetical protein